MRNYNISLYAVETGGTDEFLVTTKKIKTTSKLKARQQIYDDFWDERLSMTCTPKYVFN